MSARTPGDEKPPFAHVTSCPQDFTGPFFLAGFFRFTHGGLGERETIRSLKSTSFGERIVLGLQGQGTPQTLVTTLSRFTAQ